MQEFTGGRLGPIEPAPQLLKRLAQQGAPEDLLRIHFGTQERLERLRTARPKRGERKQTRREIQRLKKMLREVEVRVARILPHDREGALLVVGPEALARLGQASPE